MLCLVPENAHSEKCTKSAEARRGQQKCFFGDAVSVVLRLPLVDAVEAEGDEGDYENGKCGELPDGEDALADGYDGLHMGTPMDCK